MASERLMAARPAPLIQLIGSFPAGRPAASHIAAKFIMGRFGSIAGDTVRPLFIAQSFFVQQQFALSIALERAA